MPFDHEEPTALPSKKCHLQGIDLDARGDQAQRHRRLLREEILAGRAFLHHEPELQDDPGVRPRTRLARLLEGPICSQTIDGP